jgi:branched-chain amino acid transport system substrate-binding protein
MIGRSKLEWLGVASGLMLASQLLSSGPAAGSEPIKIGVVGEMSGTAGSKLPAGAAMAVAVDLALADAKSSGALKQDFTVNIRDDICKPDLAATIAREMADRERVGLVIGHSCPSASLAASQVYRERGILQIDPATTDPVLTEQQRGKPSVIFRVAERQDRAAAIAVIALRNQIAGKNVSLVGGNLQKTWFDRFRSLAAGTGGVSPTDAVPDKDAGSGVTIIYDPMNRVDLPSTSNRDDVYGVFGPDDRVGVKSGDGAKIKQLAERLKQAGYSAPLGPAINAYASIQVWVSAMNAAQSTDTNKVAEQMRKLHFDTIRGPIAFDETGDVQQPVITIVRFQNPIIEVPNQCNEPVCKDCKCGDCCPKK